MNRERLVISVLAAAAAAVGLSVVLAPDGARADEPQFRMVCGTVAPEGTPWEREFQEFKQYVEKASGGRIQVAVRMGGGSGGEISLVRRTAQATTQCFGGSTAALGTLVPELNVLESPYLFGDFAQTDRVLDAADVRSAVGRAIERRGFVFGFWAENGFRNWFTRERAITRPEDLRGLRMRSQESDVHLETYRAFGANPVGIDVTNVLTSLQTGLVDGFDNTLLFSFAASWYQGAHHVTLSRHSYQPGIIVYSKTWFDTLPADLKQVLTNVPADLVARGRDGVRRMEPILRRNLVQYGIQVHELSDADRAAFASISQGVANRVAQKAGRDARALLDAVRRAQR